MQDQLEAKRKELTAALREARPHFQWLVRFDDTTAGQPAADAVVFVVGQDEADRTWQIGLPSQRFADDELPLLVEEIIESMDDELG